MYRTVVNYQRPGFMRKDRTDEDAEIIMIMVASSGRFYLFVTRFREGKLVYKSSSTEHFGYIVFPRK